MIDDHVSQLRGNRSTGTGNDNETDDERTEISYQRRNQNFVNPVDLSNRTEQGMPFNNDNRTQHQRDETDQAQCLKTGEQYLPH